MQIAQGTVVTLRWKLSDAQGEPIAESPEPQEFLVGSDDLPAIVSQALTGRAQGDHAELHVEPDQAFGAYDAGLVYFAPRSQFDAALEPGMAFEGPPPGAHPPGLPADRLYTVTEVYAEHVVLDGNHPLAGIALRIAFDVVAVRTASPGELQRGSADGSVLMVLPGRRADTPLH